MTYVRRTTALATTALLLAAITSCSDDVADPLTTETPSASTSATPSPSSPATASATTTPPTDTEVASEAASARLRGYFATVDQLRQQPTRPIGQLSAVAISTQLAAQKRLIQGQRSSGLRQTGSTTIAKLIVQSVNLVNTGRKAGKVPTVQIDVCYDVSGVDVLDSDGKSVVGPGRPDTGWVRFLVANYKFKAAPKGGWRVASGTDLKRAPCAAS